MATFQPFCKTCGPRLALLQSYNIGHLQLLVIYGPLQVLQSLPYKLQHCRCCAFLERLTTALKSLWIKVDIHAEPLQCKELRYKNIYLANHH